jgi:threonine/homoserine/homoserine lactone efflux protein
MGLLPMSPLIEGVLAGYGIAIPVGAIAVLIVSAGMRCGFSTGFMAGAGAATADLFYAILASIAGVAISRLLAPIAIPLRMLGGLLLILLAIWGLWQGWRVGARPEETVADCRPRRTYLQFVGLTIINPLTVVYFTALVLGRDASAAQSSTADQLLFIMGAGLASLSWQTLLALLGSVAHTRLSPNFRRGAVTFGNLVVLALGLRILVLAELVPAGP